MCSRWKTFLLISFTISTLWTRAKIVSAQADPSPTAITATAPATSDAVPAAATDTNFEATVTKVISEKTVVPAGGQPQIIQELELLVTSGPTKGTTITLENGNLPLANLSKYSLGDRLVIYQEAGSNNYTIADLVRRPPLIWLFVIFVIAALVVGRLQGLTSLLGLLGSFVVVFYIVVPKIATGSNPILMVIIGCLAIVPVMFLLSHGFSKMTLVAMTATILAMLLTGLLIVIFVGWSRLTGMASEEAGFLAAMYPGLIDLRGLLIAGMLFATLGVLDDVTISQAAVVAELKKANPELTFGQLYAQASRVGRDHIASMINTLILVYAGASFPLLLLFHRSQESLALVMNYEIIADEIVRTLTGSIGLIIAVPLTTLLAVSVEQLTFTPQGT